MLNSIHLIQKRYLWIETEKLLYHRSCIAMVEGRWWFCGINNVFSRQSHVHVHEQCDAIWRDVDCCNNYNEKDGKGLSQIQIRYSTHVQFRNLSSFILAICKNFTSDRYQYTTILRFRSLQAGLVDEQVHHFLSLLIFYRRSSCSGWRDPSLPRSQLFCVEFVGGVYEHMRKQQR